MQNLFALFLVLLSFCPLPANAGAWLQKEGEGQFITSYFYQNSSHSFDVNGNKINSAEFTKNELDPYLEYGLTNKVTIGGAASFQSTNTTLSNIQIKLGYFDVFARANLYKSGDYVISLEPSLKIPVEASAQTNPEGNKPIPQIKINFGQSFNLYGIKNYTNLSAAYRARDEFADMASFEVTLGTQVMDDLVVMSQIFADKTLTGNFKAGGDYDLLKAQISGVYDLNNKYSLQAGVFDNLAGRNTSANTGLILALWYKF